MVTPEAPVNAVNMAQVINTTMARPFGTQPNIAVDKRIKRWEVWLSLRT